MALHAGKGQLKKQVCKNHKIENQVGLTRTSD